MVVTGLAVFGNLTEATAHKLAVAESGALTLALAALLWHPKEYEVQVHALWVIANLREYLTSSNLDVLASRTLLLNMVGAPIPPHEHTTLYTEY